MKYSIEWLKSILEQNTQPEYLLFWGHTQKVNGIIDKSCFSQWWPSSFVVKNVNYFTAEHWMMAKKALMFNDAESFDLIIQAAKPAEAKQLGRSVKNFDAAVWASKSYQIVVEGNLHKFSQSAPLKEFLVNTGEKVIAEASPVDNIWGIGLAADNPKSVNPFQWNGTNLLGFALMEVRDLLKN